MAFGSAFTGLDDDEGPLRPIVDTARNVGSGINSALLSDPESRSALLQIGLGLMQPQAMGQSTIGHIGQAIGGGGEAVARQEALDIAEQEAQTKAKRAEDQMTIAEMRLAQSRDPNALTAYQREVLNRQDRGQARLEAGEARRSATEMRKDINLRTKQAIEARDSTPDLITGQVSPEKGRWEGQTNDQIRKAIEAEVKGEHGEAATVTTPRTGATAVPPPASRVEGQTYQTPKGPLKWTKEGWIQP